MMALTFIKGMDLAILHTTGASTHTQRIGGVGGDAGLSERYNFHPFLRVSDYENGILCRLKNGLTRKMMGVDFFRFAQMTETNCIALFGKIEWAAIESLQYRW